MWPWKYTHGTEQSQNVVKSEEWDTFALQWHLEEEGVSSILRAYGKRYVGVGWAQMVVVFSASHKFKINVHCKKQAPIFLFPKFINTRTNHSTEKNILFVLGSLPFSIRFTQSQLVFQSDTWYDYQTCNTCVDNKNTWFGLLSISSFLWQIGTKYLYNLNRLCLCLLLKQKVFWRGPFEHLQVKGSCNIILLLPMTTNK